MTYAPTVQKTISLLETLVGFDTTSRESNLGLIEYVRDHLQSLGLAVRLSYDADKRKGKFEGTVPESSFDFEVSAEAEPNVASPSGKVVFDKRVAK